MCTVEPWLNRPPPSPPPSATLFVCPCVRVHVCPCIRAMACAFPFTVPAHTACCTTSDEGTRVLLQLPRILHRKRRWFRKS